MQSILNLDLEYNPSLLHPHSLPLHQASFFFGLILLVDYKAERTNSLLRTDKKVHGKATK